MITYVTAITNNFGFLPNIASYKNENRSFICFYDSDDTVDHQSGWDFQKIEYDSKNARIKQRYVKCNFQDLVNSDYYCWIDPRHMFLSDSFFLHVENIIENDSFDILIQPHPIRKSLSDEFVWAYTTGKLSYSDCMSVIDCIQSKSLNLDDYFSTLLSIFVVKSNEKTKKMGNRWFDLIIDCYHDKCHSIRDQIIFPFSVENLKVLFFNIYEFGGYEEWIHNLGIKYADFDGDSPKGLDWRPHISSFLTDIQLKTGSTIHSPMFGLPIA